MKKKNITSSGGSKQGDTSNKKGPAKQDKRENDPTRIRPENENQVPPVEAPEDPSSGPRNKGIEDPGTQSPYNRTPGHKQDPVEEPGKEQGSDINKGYNPAAPNNRQDETTERDDSGNPVMKSFGRGL